MFGWFWYLEKLFVQIEAVPGYCKFIAQCAVYTHLSYIEVRSELLILWVRLELDVFATENDVDEVTWSLSLLNIDLWLIRIKFFLLNEVLRSGISDSDRLIMSLFDFLEIVQELGRDHRQAFLVHRGQAKWDNNFFTFFIVFFDHSGSTWVDRLPIVDGRDHFQIGFILLLFVP